jgi:hypothetical protein
MTMKTNRIFGAIALLAVALALPAPYDLAALARSARVRTGVGEGAEGSDVIRSSTSELATDELQLTLQDGTGGRFLEVVNLIMGTETARQLSADRFVVRQGPGGNRDDFAAFFAAAPYVREVKPRPTRRPSEQLPGVRVRIPARSQPAAGTPGGAAPAGRDHVAGEILIKFKRGTSPQQIDQFNLENGTRVIGRLDLGEDRIYRLAIPEGVEVPDLATAFSALPQVEYAEPNFRMGIPPLPGAPQSGPPDRPKPPRLPAQPGPVVVAADEVLGDSVFVSFRPGVREPVPDLVALVFGVERLDGDDRRVRYSLPRGSNPLAAVRLFKLCPYVLGAEPSY